MHIIIYGKDYTDYDKNLQVFICGGEDLKLYKFDYETGMEIGRPTKTYYKHLLKK